MRVSGSRTPADPGRIGTRTEGIVLAALLEGGFDVLVPFGNRAKYDFVVDDGSRLRRVQCKTAQRVGWPRPSCTTDGRGVTSSRQ